MTPYYVDDQVTLYAGEALEVVRVLADGSVDAVVTDPPYGLEFMGREWDGADGFRRSLNGADAGRESVFGRTSRTSPEYRASALYQQWCQAWAAECLRLLKPGGHLLAFGGTRTVHRLTCAIEDAGFEIRDGIDWLYGSGFPKSLDVSKAIDKAAGAEREVVGLRTYPDGEVYKGGSAAGRSGGRLGGGAEGTPRGPALETAPATDAAARWSGWGTALKPAREPIVVARKPFAGTVAANVEAYGTGALNIDGCRIGTAEEKRWPGQTRSHQRYDPGSPSKGTFPAPHDGLGRWPSNVVLDEDAAAELDRQSGVLTSGKLEVHHCRTVPRLGHGGTYGNDAGTSEWGASYGDSGGASSYFPVFRYEAKAPTTERPRADGVAHPTVKPVELMRWLVRLVTPPGGLVLDLFAGSGTTGEACVAEGFRCLLVEREPAYLPLIVARLSKPIPLALPLEAS